MKSKSMQLSPKSGIASLFSCWVGVVATYDGAVFVCGTAIATGVFATAEYPARYAGSIC